MNTASDIRRWEYDFTVRGVRDIADIKAHMVGAMRNAAGTLTDPTPEALVSDLNDLDAGVVKLRALWWTKASRQHQMLASYDAVLIAIQRASHAAKATPIAEHDRAA
ncbi:MAG: hypothetical protein ABSD75_04570 [Terriglobales bacterium]